MAYGLRPTKALILEALDNGRELSGRQLLSLLGRSRGSIDVSITELRSAGEIVGQPDKLDKRVTKWRRNVQPVSP